MNTGRYCWRGSRGASLSLTAEVARVGHLLAHTGGGVGAFLSSALRTERFGPRNQHVVVQLLEPRDLRCLTDIGRMPHVSAITAPDASELKSIVESLDVLIVHWWHHPALHDALWALRGLSTRLILWSHVNGVHTPRIPGSLLRAASLVVTSSQTSHRNLLMRDDVPSTLEAKSLCVYSLAYLETYLALHKSLRSHSVAYAGTIDFSKLTSNFVDLLPGRSELPEVTLFGQPTCQEQLMHEASRRDGPRLRFRGHSDNLASALDGYGIFLYPLAREHYGTTENVLQESMALGLIPLVLPNQTEAEIVGPLANQLTFSDREGLSSILAELKDPGIRGPLSVEVQSIVLERWTEWLRSSDIKDAIGDVSSLPRQSLDLDTASDDERLAQRWLPEMLHPECPETYCAAVDSLFSGNLSEEQEALISASTWRLWANRTDDRRPGYLS